MTRPRFRLLTAIVPASLAVAALAVGGIGLHDVTQRLPLDHRTVDRTTIDAERYFRDYRQGESDAGSRPGSGPVFAAGTGVAAQGRNGSRITAPGSSGWPGVLDDNTFVDAGSAGVVSTARDPLSTFGLDVDTGSYTVGRTLLRAGHLPPRASVRPEEWVNAFDYGYPAPQRDLGVTVDQVSLGGAPAGTRLVRIGVQAREVDVERQPVAVTLVVDVSGSMDIRERLGLVRSSLALLAKNLRDDDTIALVSYDDAATPLLGPTPVRKTATILSAIDRLKPGNSTNLEAGLRLGYDQAREAYRQDAINAVVLCSDGVANVGLTNPDALAAMIRKSGTDGIHLVTVGYGMGNYNDDLMEQLADQGDGFYRYVDTFAEAQKVFRDDLVATLTPVARDAKVQVAFDPSAVSSYRLVGYENRAIADRSFTDPAVDAGEIGAGHDVTALYEVTLAVGDDHQPFEQIGTVDLRWTSVDGSADRILAVIPAVAGQETATGTTELAAAVADLAQLLRHSATVQQRGVSLPSLEDRAEDLQRRQVAGADDLLSMVQLAEQARP
jgi:Ca-activated chloride channel family protein